jgi:hypothetical protein
VSGYYRAPDIPTIQGQNFGREMGNASERELILSRLMASRLFHKEDPIGKRIQMGARGAWSTVVGVADNVRNSGLTEQDEPEVYVLRRSVPEDWEGLVALSGNTGGDGPVMIVKTDLPRAATVTWIHSQLTHIDPAVPVEIEPLTEFVRQLAARPRFQTVLLSFFAFIGLTLAAIGLYGVISFLAMQRKQEIGVRMALGADRFDILWLIAREGLQLIVLGGLTGLIAALGISRAFQSLLFNVRQHDPINFITVAFILMLVAFFATLLPARSAMKTDPLVALRYE